MAEPTHAQVRADERAAQTEHERLAKAGIKDEKNLSPEEKEDKRVQEENRKRREERTKLVDETFVKLQTEAEKAGDPHATAEIIKEVADRAAKTQIIAAGARYEPSPLEMEELNKQVFPLIAPPLPDGTPVAHISQVEKKEDDTAKPKTAHGVAGK